MPRLSAVVIFCLAGWCGLCQALTLSTEEQAWLVAHPNLRLGIDPTWPPFESLDEHGDYKGLGAGYVHLIENKLGRSIEQVKPHDWSEVLALAKVGKIDLLPAIMSTPERRGYLTFTRPFLDFPVVILAREGHAQPRDIDALYGLKVAVVENYAPHELLRDQHPDLNLQLMPNVYSALQALATGKVDAFVGDLGSTVWTQRQFKIDGLNVSGETPYHYQLAMAAPRAEATLIGIIDRILAEMTPEEISALQKPWVGGLQDDRPHWSALLLYGLPISLALLAVLGYMVRTNRRLSSEIFRRVALEQELRSSEYHFRGLVESLSAIAWESRSTDYTYTYVSPHAEALLGYPLGHWLRPGFWRSVVHPEDLAPTQAYCAQESRARRDHSVDYRVIAADGQILWIRDIVSLIEYGQHPLMRGLMIDITEARATEAALNRSEKKFASVFRQCPDILVIASLEDGRLLEVNRAFEEQIGISAADAVGHTVTELNIWGIPGSGAKLMDYLKDKDLRNVEMPFRRHDGRLFTGLVSAGPVQFDSQSAIVAVVSDISPLKEAVELLRISEEKFARAFHASPDGMLISRLSDGRLLEVNEGFSRISGYDAATVAYRTTVDLGLWADLKEREVVLRALRGDGYIRNFAANIRHRDGGIRICELSAQILPIGDETCVLTIARDVTESQLMQIKLRQAATVFESTAEGVMITDTSQRISAVNRAFSEITGYSEAEALGQTPRLLASGQHDSAFYAAMWHQLASEGHWQGEICNRRKNDQLYPAWLTINAVRTSQDEISHFVAVFADISSIKHAQARLDYQAHHDHLTGLPNRILFEARLQAALEDHSNERSQGAVLFLDLDRFKHINDSLGHPVGDLLLKSTAQRLKEQLRDVDTVARLGGDEFIILLPGLHQPSDAEHIAQKVLACFTAPFQAGEHEFFISASIGASLYPRDGQDVATLVKNADAAMYRSKAKGRNRVETYTQDLTIQANERIALEHELRRAIERNELFLSYQAKVSLTDKRLVGAEALVRWRHPVLGDVSPERFITLAEDNGMILQIGDWVLQHACEQLGRWHQTYEDFGPLSVNLAGAQLRQPNLLSRIEQLLADHGLRAESLQLEITENFIMTQTEEALAVLHQLKSLGVQLAIDDFGTGYSSLSYLKRLPLDILKIDQSFVQGLPTDPHDAAIVRAIIALGNSLQLTVIAEGVETSEQQQFLHDEGCEQIQGFSISTPLQAEAFAAKFLRLLPSDLSDISDGTNAQPSL